MSNRNIVIVAVIAFIIGLIVSGISKDDKKPAATDAKNLLEQAKDEVSKIEQENVALKSQLENKSRDNMSKELDLMKNTVKTLEDTIGAKNDEITQLQAEIKDRDAKIAAAEVYKTMSRKLETRLGELETENQQLTTVVEKISMFLSETNRQAVPEPAIKLDKPAEKKSMIELPGKSIIFDKKEAPRQPAETTMKEPAPIPADK